MQEHLNTKDINLIPDKILYRNQIFLGKVVKALVYTIAGLFLAAILSLPVYRRIDLQQKVNRLSGELDNISLQELNLAEAELANKTREKKELEKMLSSISGTEVKTTELIAIVTSKMPAGISAESIMYQPEMAELTVRAVSTGREDITVFLKRLYNETLFTGIIVSEIRGTGSGSTGRYNFSVVIKTGRKE